MKLKLHIDPDANAVYLRLNASTIIESQEVHPGVVLDFDANDQVVGIEILGVKDRVPVAHLRPIQSDVG